MNKLVALNNIRNEKNKELFTLKEDLQEQGYYNRTYVAFEEKFNFLKDKVSNLIKENNGTSSCENNINKILERIFLRNNESAIIYFINSIYNDELSLNTRIEYVDNKTLSSKDSNYNIIILADDEYRKFKYKVEFITADNQNMAIVINKENLSSNDKNIINFNMKRKIYENHNSSSLKRSYSKCLIMLNSNIQVPDVYEFRSDCNGQDVGVDIIKSWKFDFKQLSEKDLYLLFPLKVIDIEKRLLYINVKLVSKDLIKKEIRGFFRDMNVYLKKGKDSNLITEKEITELNLIAIDLLSNLIKERNSIFVDIKIDIEETLKEIVV